LIRGYSGSVRTAMKSATEIGCTVRRGVDDLGFFLGKRHWAVDRWKSRFRIVALAKLIR
jgi:hypothetical protein